MANFILIIDFPNSLLNGHTIFEIMIIIIYCWADAIGGWSVYSNYGLERQETAGMHSSHFIMPLTI